MASPAVGFASDPQRAVYNLDLGRYDHFTVGDSVDMWPDDTSKPISRQSKVPQPPVRLEKWESTRKGAAIADGTVDPNQEYVLFVHGWRLNTEERRSFAETAIKRMFWQGYRGGVGLYSWPTEYVPDSVGYNELLFFGGNYVRTEEKAWNSANGLRDLLHQLNATDQYAGNVRVFAHSQGNIVASEALRQEAKSPNPNANLMHSYVTTNSAMAASAYDVAVSELRRLCVA